MKNILYSIIILCLFSCVQDDNRKNTYPTKEEKRIIENMTCWKSVYAERMLLAGISYKNDKKKDRERWAEWHKYKNEAEKRGQISLYNDTLFINIIRSDSLYNALCDERKKLSQVLSIYKESVPFFVRYIDKISDNIIEYNYYNYKGLGIYERPLKKDILNIFYEYYKNYSELLKEGYSLPENSNIKEEDILNMNSLLKSIENLDRRLWAVKYFKTSKSDLEKIDLEQKRANQVDSLFN